MKGNPSMTDKEKLEAALNAFGTLEGREDFIQKYKDSPESIVKQAAQNYSRIMDLLEELTKLNIKPVSDVFYDELTEQYGFTTDEDRTGIEVSGFNRQQVAKDLFTAANVSAQLAEILRGE